MDKLKLAESTAREALQSAKQASELALYAISHSDNRDTINALMSDMRKQQMLADDALLAYQQIKRQEAE